MRTVFVCVSLAVLAGASSTAAAQSFGDMAGRIGSTWLGIGMASMLETTRAPDGPFRKDASDHDLELAERLGKLLPPGTDLRTASRGFRNLGEFVTTLRASINLAIAFDALKAKVVAGGAISDAIESLRPGVDGLVEARRARLMAREDLKKT